MLCISRFKLLSPNPVDFCQAFYFLSRRTNGIKSIFTSTRNYIGIGRFTEENGIVFNRRDVGFGAKRDVLYVAVVVGFYSAVFEMNRK